MLTEDDLFIFTHIPKTAGMTFKRLLERRFPARQMPKIGPDYQGSIDQIRSLSDAEKARVRCLSGHVPYGIHRYFPGKTPRYVAFVRDPVDRTLSEYFFLLKRPQLMPLLGLDPNTKLTPEAFLEHAVSMGMLDFQTRVLSGYDNMVASVLPPYEKMAVASADALIKEIEDAYAVIGTVERFDETLLLMKEMFGWRNVYYISRNVNRGSHARSERTDLKKALGDDIRKLNPLDGALYAHFSEALNAKLAEHGADFPQRLSRYRSNNRLYSKGWSLYRATGLRRLRKALAKLQMLRDARARRGLQEPTIATSDARTRT